MSKAVLFFNSQLKFFHFFRWRCHSWVLTHLNHESYSFLISWTVFILYLVNAAVKTTVIPPYILLIHLDSMSHVSFKNQCLVSSSNLISYHIVQNIIIHYYLTLSLVWGLTRAWTPAVYLCLTSFHTHIFVWWSLLNVEKIDNSWNGKPLPCCLVCVKTYAAVICL